ncbi:glycosyltransferase family 2 protein [Sandarakinorhabdus oryzae]|uniref:glycosyltransferase family 2 protein n=1 Tax=Sandarakinorhabdus oryzae TaxID=2675220 RepID=UPI0012E190EA|nr:glycosyltransferase family A protein [Sandarakinorhabdus oryzae]
MPSYNRAGLIGRTITSVLAQTLGSFELIIVDDGSTDDTLGVLAALPDPRIAIYQQRRNAGAPAARNAGVAMARSPLVAFQDSDDEWAPDLLTAHFKALTTADVSFCQLDQRYGEARALYPPPGWQLSADVYAQLLATSHISTQTLAMTRAIFDQVGGFDPAMPRFQDWDLVLRLAQAGARFRYIPEPLAIAHDSPDSLTRSVEKGIIGRRRLIEKHADALASQPVALARHHYIMGSQLRRLGRFSEARAQFATALGLAPGDWRSAGQWLLAALRR